MADAAPSRYPGLQIHEEMPFQWRDWRAQRVAWVMGLVLVLLAAAGLLGPGPLSHQQAQSTDGAVQVDYLRWARRGAKANLGVRIPADLAQDGTVSVVLPSAYLSEWELREVTPRPAEVEANGQHVRFVFAAPRPEGAVELEFVLQGQGMGPLDGELLVGDQRVTWWQFLWP